MRKIIAYVLLVLVGLTGCAPAVPVQPITTSNVTPSQNTTQHVSDVKMLHNDDIVMSPGGPVYRGGVQGPNEPVWPTLGGNTTSVPAFNGTIMVACRNYIETLAGELRNEFLFLDASAAPNLDDPLKVTYDFVGLPVGVSANLTQKGYGGIGRPNYRVVSVFIELTIPVDVKAGEYSYTIHLAYQGTEFGIVPSVLKVFPPEPETCGVTYVPGKFLYVWGTTTSPVPDGTMLVSNVYPFNGLASWSQPATVKTGIWSANFSLGKDGVPSNLDVGTYNIYVWPADNPIVIGSISFSIVPPP